MRRISHTTSMLMNNPESANCRYFTTYTGVKMPLRLVSELTAADLDNRNTYFRGLFDAAERVTCIEKVVYGEIELRHVYQYDADGRLATAEVTDADGEVTRLVFDEAGNAQEAD
jgi:YD repeat-containing protein